MWNMPSKGGMRGLVLLTTPDSQKPPRSECVRTVEVIFPPGPNGLADIVPVQVQFPSKNLSCAISGAGLGIAMSAFAGFWAGLPFTSCANVHGVAASHTAATTAIVDFAVIVPPRYGEATARAAARAKRRGESRSARGGGQDARERLEDLAAVRRTQLGLGGAPGIRPEADPAAGGVADAPDGGRAPVHVGGGIEPAVLRRVAEHHLAFALEPGDLLRLGVEVPLAVGDGHGQHAAGGDAGGDGGVRALHADVHGLGQELHSAVA